MAPATSKHLKKVGKGTMAWEQQDKDVMAQWEAGEAWGQNC